MTSLIGLLLLAAICAAILGGLKSFFALARKPAAKTSPLWEPLKSDPLPYRARKHFFSAAERSFYEVLRRLAPDHTVFAKVRVADLVYVAKSTESRQAHFNRIQSKHVDFVICDRNLALVVVVELDDSSHEREDRKSRDAFVDAALEAASLPIVHIRAQRGYALDEIRQALLPYLGVLPTPMQSSLEYAGAGN